MIPIDSDGTLPACAAGTSTDKGPGKPFDSVADMAVESPSAEQLAAAAVADALAAARNPPTQSALDRGFPPPPPETGSGAFGSGAPQ
jgi:hypothetical protein